MNKILMIILVLLIGGGIWFYFMGTAKPKMDTVTETKSADITIQDFKYTPARITVKAGATVSVLNKDIAGHSVTSTEGKFDTGILGKDGTGTFTAPSKPGEYKFLCTPHPSITGVLVVE